MIWRTYLYRETLKIFCLVFFSLFLLATLIDFSAHMKTFWHAGTGIFTYYLAQLSRQADLLVGMALLLANVKVLTTLSMRGEITALLASGVPLRRLTYPLLTIGCAFTALLFFNVEVIQPRALAHLAAFETPSNQNEVFALALQDHSRLLYQRFDKEKERFCDLFWIQDQDHLFRINELSPFEKRAYGVDVLERVEGEIVSLSSHDTLDFPEMSFETKSLAEATLPADWQKLSQLFHNLPSLSGTLRDYEAKVVAAFCQKLTSPLLALLVIIAPAPWCLRFGRQRRLFLLYALAIASLLAYFVCTQAAAILGKSHIFNPFWITALPPLLMTTLFGVRYAKL